MTVDEAANRLRQLLTDAGFDSRHPDAAVAWNAFKRFATEPVHVATTELWFEAGDGDPTTDSPAYFDFVRMFTHYPDDGSQWSEQVTAHFMAPANVELGLRGRCVHAKDIANPERWFVDVEASQAFKNGIIFTGWSFEVRVDGC